MPDDLSVALERLRTSAQRLNRTSDEAAKTIREIESFLEESGVDLFATVEVHTWKVNEPKEGTQGMFLQYKEMASGKYRIAVVYLTLDSECEVTEERGKAWAECSRKEKLQSYAKLPELLVELAGELEGEVAGAERIVNQVSPNIAALSKKRKGGA